MAPWLLAAAYEAFDRLQCIWADMAYRGQRLRTRVEQECGWILDLVHHPRRWGWYPVDVEPPPMPAFSVLPRRWEVERTIAWIGRYRRLSKDYEHHPESSETDDLRGHDPVDAAPAGPSGPDGLPSPQRRGLEGLAWAFETASTDPDINR
jgi:transposase